MKWKTVLFKGGISTLKLKFPSGSYETPHVCYVGNMEPDSETKPSQQ